MREPLETLKEIEWQRHVAELKETDVTECKTLESSATAN